MKLFVIAFVIAAVCWLLAYFYKRNRSWLNPIGWAWYFGGVMALIVNR